MNNWCNYSDLPSPDWYDCRVRLTTLVRSCVREDLWNETDLILSRASDEDLENLFNILNDNELSLIDNKSSENKTDDLIHKVLIEIDYLTSKLIYFKKIPKDFTKTFGLSSELIPDLIAKWREQKIDSLLP